jgi:hypothetical protein
MVFDPGKFPDPKTMWNAPLEATKQGDVPSQQTPVNVEKLGDYYEWVGLPRDEARKVPKYP